MADGVPHHVRLPQETVRRKQEEKPHGDGRDDDGPAHLPRGMYCAAALVFHQNRLYKWWAEWQILTYACLSPFSPGCIILPVDREVMMRYHAIPLVGPLLLGLLAGCIRPAAGAEGGIDARRSVGTHVGGGRPRGAVLVHLPGGFPADGPHPGHPAAGRAPGVGHAVAHQRRLPAAAAGDPRSSPVFRPRPGGGDVPSRALGRLQ